MNASKGKIDRLRKAGVIKKDVRLPAQYRSVLESLTDKEISVLVDLYEDLGDAETELRRRKGKTLRQCFIPL